MLLTFFGRYLNMKNTVLIIAASVTPVFRENGQMVQTWSTSEENYHINISQITLVRQVNPT